MFYLLFFIYTLVQLNNNFVITFYIGTAFKRYVLLRTLLSTEFAMPLIEDESMIKSEWEETFNFLLRQNYISIRNNAYIQGQNPKVFSLLYNVMLPFIDAIYITCLVLFEVK